jgi:type IV secretory pathway TraG/TraD family ATPase VirD4
MPETDNDITLFAKTNFRNREVAFGIRRDDRRRHVYIIGKTGMGKTTLIENLVIQDILNGNGVAFVDPHGDSVEKVLNYIPSNRVNDVVYLNPADTDFPIAFNPLEFVGDKYKHLGDCSDSEQSRAVFVICHHQKHGWPDQICHRPSRNHGSKKDFANQLIQRKNW